ncbi:hypothetical protein RCOM_0716670 [Ricinus communis]|uniref:Alkaline/neutral invertase n=1 Tax=Ricinus communis TaxID=3988 RepID=B9SBE7_RICCO|nr:hypothetical protein RCOM_0716670 [Ricinus communis]
MSPKLKDPFAQDDTNKLESSAENLTVELPLKKKTQLSPSKIVQKEDSKEVPASEDTVAADVLDISTSQVDLQVPEKHFEKFQDAKSNEMTSVTVESSVENSPESSSQSMKESSPEANGGAIKAIPSVSVNRDSLDNVSPGVKSISESGAVVEEAWERLNKSYVLFKGKPVGTLAAMDPGAEALNYNQVLGIADTMPSLMRLSISKVEKRGLTTSLLKKVSMPASYKVLYYTSDGKTSRYVEKQARNYQTWNIAGYLVAKTMIENPSNLLSISLVEDKKIAKPTLTRSASF